MDGEYRGMFGVSEDDKFLRANIPAIPVQVMRELVDQYVGIINARPLDAGQWARFRRTLVAYAKRWRADVFNWSSVAAPSGQGSRPILRNAAVHINHGALGNETARYFVVLVVLSDVSGCEFDFWSPILDQLGV